MKRTSSPSFCFQIPEPGIGLTPPAVEGAPLPAPQTQNSADRGTDDSADDTATRETSVEVKNTHRASDDELPAKEEVEVADVVRKRSRLRPLQASSDELPTKEDETVETRGTSAEAECLIEIADAQQSAQYSSDEFPTKEAREQLVPQVEANASTEEARLIPQVEAKASTEEARLIEQQIKSFKHMDEVAHACRERKALAKVAMAESSQISATLVEISIDLKLACAQHMHMGQ